jgi:hypothetical protein
VTYRAAAAAVAADCWGLYRVGPNMGNFVLFWPVRPEARTAQKKKHPAPLRGRGWRSIFLRAFCPKGKFKKHKKIQNYKINNTIKIRKKGQD